MTFKCSYGCGRDAILQNKSGKWMCDTSPNKCPENRKKNSSSLSDSYSTGRRINQKDQYSKLPEETKAKMAWSKGLSKDVDQRLQNVSAGMSRSKKGMVGRPHSQTTKEKMSLRRIQFLETHSKHCDWFLVGDTKVQGTLEKKFAEFLLTNDVRYERNRLKFQGHRRYTPDFFLPDYDLYVEIKGFLYDKDKEKIRRVLAENNVDIRIAFKDDLQRIMTIEDVLSLSKVEDHIKDIDYSKFTNHWGS